MKSFVVAQYGVTYGIDKAGTVPGAGNLATNDPSQLASGAIGVYAVRGSADKPVFLASGDVPTLGLQYFTGGTTPTVGSPQNVTALLICQGTATDDYVSVEVKGSEIASWKKLAYADGTTKVVYAGNQATGTLSIDWTGASTDEFLVKVVGTTKGQEPLPRASASLTKGALLKADVVINLAGQLTANPANNFVRVEAVGAGQTSASTNTGTYTTAIVTNGSKTILLNGTNVEIASGDYMEISGVFYYVSTVTTTNSLDTITLSTAFAGVSNTALAKASIKRMTVQPTYVGLKFTGIDPSLTTKTGVASPLSNFEVAVAGAFVISTGTPINTTTALANVINPTTTVALMEQQAREYQGFEARHLIERFTQPTWFVDAAKVYSLLTLGFKHAWTSSEPTNRHSVEDEVVIACEKNGAAAASTITAQATIIRAMINAYVESIPVQLPVISSIA